MAGISEGDLVEDADIKRGRTYGPFNTAGEMVASIEANTRKLTAVRKRAKPAR